MDEIKNTRVKFRLSNENQKFDSSKYLKISYNDILGYYTTEDINKIEEILDAN